MNFSQSVQIDAPVEVVFAFCASPDGFEKHFPQPVRWLDTDKAWKLGSKFQFEYRFLFIWWYWQAEIVDYKPNSYFVDFLISDEGLKHFEHRHDFKSQGDKTLYTDNIQFSSGLGSWIDRTIAIRIIRLIFSKRHEKLKKYFKQ